jgi:hypothetical protein
MGVFSQHETKAVVFCYKFETGIQIESITFAAE